MTDWPGMLLLVCLFIISIMHRLYLDGLDKSLRALANRVKELEDVNGNQDAKL